MTRLRKAEVDVAAHLDAVNAQILYKWQPGFIILSASDNITERAYLHSSKKVANPTIHGKMTVSMELLLTLLAAWLTSNHCRLFVQPHRFKHWSTGLAWTSTLRVGLGIRMIDPEALTAANAPSRPPELP